MFLSDSIHVSMLKIAAFASGKGSNLTAIVEAIEHGKIQNARIEVVISNNSHAGALAVADKHQIPALHLSRQQFESDESYTGAIQKVLTDHAVNFIVLAGYMKKVDPSIVRAYRNRILNIHPALLPKFGGAGMYGLRVHEAVIAAGEKQSGATVHVVDEEYDHGTIILQRKIDVAAGETPETLAEKVLRIEHEIYPEAIRLFANGAVTIDHYNTVTIAE